MSIVTSCESCGKRYALGDHLAGRRLKCKACGAVITAPSAAAAEPAYDEPAFDPPAPPPAAPPMLPRAGRGASHASTPQPMWTPPAAAAPVTTYTPRPTARRSSESAGIPFLDRVSGLLLPAAGIAALITLILVPMGMSGAIEPKTAFLLILLPWVLVMLANGILAIILVARESIVCLVLYLVVPFYGIYYVLTRWETMGRVVIVGVIGWVCIFATSKTLVPKVDGADGSSLADGSDGNYNTSSSESGGDGSPGEGRRPPSFANEGGPAERPSDNPAERARAAHEERQRIVAEAQQRFDQSKAQVQAFVTRDFRGMTREQALAEWTTLRDQIEAERKQADSRILNASMAWGQLSSALSMVRGRLEALPSDSAPAVVFQEPTDNPPLGQPKAASSLGEEISFRELRIRPPQAARFDLGSNESDKERGMVWTGGSPGDGSEGNWSMSIRQSPKSNPKQKQPWVASHDQAIAGAQRDGLWFIDSRNTSVSPLLINGMRFWRTAPIIRPGSEQSSSATVRYTAGVGDDWLVIELNPGPEPGRYAMIAQLDDAACSLRRQKPGEAKVDPFSVERVAARIGDQPDAALRILRQHGPAAEPVVAPLLASTDAQVARTAAVYLADFGTAASLPQFRKAAGSADPTIADAARKALRRLAPGEFDMLAEVLLDLKSPLGEKRSAAIAKLVDTPVQPTRRAEVATLLEDALLSAEGGDRETVAKALENWWGEKTATRLLPILSKEDADPSQRDAALSVVAATKSKTAAGTVVRWLLKEPEKTTAALIRMGDAAEDATVKLYNSLSLSRDPAHVAVRANCVKVLSETGVTQQSIMALTRAAKDGRDVATQDVAKAGIESVRARMVKK